MIRTQIYIPETIHQSAKMVARKQKETLASLLRRLIVTGLKEERKKVQAKSLDSLVGLGLKGGPKDLSSKMDEYLYGGK